MDYSLINIAKIAWGKFVGKILNFDDNVEMGREKLDSYNRRSVRLHMSCRCCIALELI